MYDPGAAGVVGGLFAYTITRNEGRVRQYSLTDADGDEQLSASKVRDFSIGAEAEGCVADDANAALFISEEDTALWRYGARPSDGASRTRVASAHATSMPEDLEGVALTDDAILVSAQNTAHPSQNFITAYARTSPHRYLGSVRVVAGSGSDDCDQTDGIAAADVALGSRFTRGLFVCHDGSNDAPGSSGNQNFKLVDLGALLNALA
jgi:3-phytase